MNKFIITPSLFFQLDMSPLWIWLDLFGDQSKKEPLSEFALKLLDDGNLHEEKYVESLEVIEVTEMDPIKGADITLQLMKEGVPLIYQGWLQFEQGDRILRGRPDLLEKQKGTSRFGNWVYCPVDIKASSDIKNTHIQQLAFYAFLLEQIQGSSVGLSWVVNRHFQRLPVLLDQAAIESMQNAIAEIVGIFQGKKPDVHISSKVKNSPWYKECLKEAEKKNDVSLIYGLREDTAKHLRSIGIDTLEKVSQVKIENLPKVHGASLETLRKAKTQAKALIEKSPILIGSPISKDEKNLTLYFDIEGSKNPEVEYLLGFWIIGDLEGKYASIGHVDKYKEDGEKYFLYFLAEDASLEKEMWDKFLAWLALLPEDYSVYHYASYEKTALRKLSERCCSSSRDLERFQDKLIDLEKEVKKTVVLPLYFYSIKDIAKSPFVNFKWRHAKAGGAQSMFWYEQWLKTGDRSILQDIIRYNEDDVRATEHVNKWLAEFSRV
jgi:predicted RecB family nuclease